MNVKLQQPTGDPGKLVYKLDPVPDKDWVNRFNAKIQRQLGYQARRKNGPRTAERILVFFKYVKLVSVLIKPPLFTSHYRVDPSRCVRASSRAFPLSYVPMAFFAKI